jgi:hypothetical protein
MFTSGATAIACSVLVIIASYVRTPHSHDYIQQYEEAVPFLQSGFLLAFGGLVLCFFGTGWRRLVLVPVGLALSVFWFMLAGSSL